MLTAKSAAQKANQEKFLCCFVFFQILLFKNSALSEGVLIWFLFFLKEDRNWEALRILGMVHTFMRTDSATRQEALCQAEPRMLLITLSWDEIRKNPRIKLLSKYMKCSLIYCSSKTSTRIFVIRFWFPSRLERTLIWNYIFWSISARCSLDNSWKLFSFFFFLFWSEHRNLKFPFLFPYLLFIFSFTFILGSF